MSMNDEEIRVLKQLMANNKAYIQRFYCILDKLEARIEQLEDTAELLFEEFKRLRKEVLNCV